MARVPAAKTPLTEHELFGVLALGHEMAFGAVGSMERLGVAWAQLALESGRGRAVFHNNIGNVTRRPTGEGDWYHLTTVEYMKGDGKQPKEMALAYRVYASPQDATAGYWRLLAARYKPALVCFDAGDAAAAALELGRLGYYTARRDTYAAAMASLYREFVRRFADPPPSGNA